jgi:hypothetical protein
MQAKKAATDVLAAVKVLQHAREACANLKPLSHPMTPEELAQRAKMIETVIRTRKLLQAIQGRADDLSDALERFKVRREAIRA